MNDPHVVSLIFQVKHGSLVDYSQAEPLVREEPAFRLEVKDKQARFEMKGHYATEDEARKAIEEYICVWELDACLERRDPNFFHLEFNKSQIIDRNPAPGLSAHFEAGTPTFSATLGPVRPNYPVPPSNISLDANVKTMYQRYMGYHRGHEKLTEMAYFCLTLLENSAQQPPSKVKQRRRTSKKRQAAAEKYAIAAKVFDKVGNLCRNKGGPEEARKADGMGNSLTEPERQFLEQAIEIWIRRMAEMVHSPSHNFQKISRSDLPPI